MFTRYPDYYRKFQCLAEKCPDTCCVGWKISVDKETLSRYRQWRRENSVLGRKLRRYVRRGELVPVVDRCAFLDKKGLCGLYSRFGKTAMCRTCRRYPRHMEHYEEFKEAVLLLSCPEACRLVLEHETGLFYVKRGENQAIEDKFLSALLKVRKVLYKIGTDQRLTIDGRLAMCLSLAHDVQRRIDGGRTGEIKMVLERYEKESAAGRFLEKIKSMDNRDGRFLLMSDFMELLAHMDVISPQWPDMLEDCRRSLYHSRDSRLTYETDRKQFLEESRELEIHWERLFGYFLYSFFLASLYDRDLYTKVKMAVFCCLAVEELDYYFWRQETRRGRDSVTAGDGSFHWLERQVEVCHILARQIENSDENRRRLEEQLRSGRFGVKEAVKILHSECLNMACQMTPFGQR